MELWKKVLVTVAVPIVIGTLTLAVWAADVTVQELTAKLWPKDRIEAALKDLDKQKADGLISPQMYNRKKKMLQERLAGTFKDDVLSATNPPPNLLQNASFEDFNPNTRRNMSRWDFWGGWAWPETAEYQNDKEDRPEYVHSGKLSGRFKCTGQPARTGINQTIPTIAGATEYELTIWAKGEGENQLQIAFESGANGTFTGKIGPEWKQITVTGKADPNAKKFTLYIYARGGGTVWVDDAKLLPVGVKIED
jgi:hypothetical protein